MRDAGVAVVTVICVLLWSRRRVFTSKPQREREREAEKERARHRVP